MYLKQMALAAAIFLAGNFAVGDSKADAGQPTNDKALKDSVYRNNFFGFSMTLPKDWSVQGKEMQKKLNEAGRKMLAGDDKNYEAVIKASQKQESPFEFSVFKYPVGSPVDFNPSLIGSAEKVADQPGIKKGEDFLFHVRKTLEASQLKFEFQKEIHPEKLGDTDFGVMEATLSIRNMSLTQKYYCVIRKGYAITFTISYLNEADGKELAKILESVSFK